MDRVEARETLNQLLEYTAGVSKHVGVEMFQEWMNYDGAFGCEMPLGTVNHSTGSNRAMTKRRPLGRIPALLDRFARGGCQGVGVHFIVWDDLVPKFDEIRSRFPLLKGMPSEVFFFGDDLVFWHAGWVNNRCYGVEIRNSGRLIFDRGVFFWGGTNRYYGRIPEKLGDTWWEPYSIEQIRATVWVHRLMAATHMIDPMWFLNHVHVSSNRPEDPGPHFPLARVREAVLLDHKDTPIEKLGFPLSFRAAGDVEEPEGVIKSELELHRGLFRNALDGGDSGESEGVRGEDDEREEDRAEAKSNLRALGYYCPEDRLPEALKIFQSRWMRRRSRHPLDGGDPKPDRGWSRAMRVNGKANEATIRKLREMRRGRGRIRE